MNFFEYTKLLRENKNNFTKLKEILEQNKVVYDGYQLLIWSINHKYDYEELIINCYKNLDINQQDDDGNTPLMMHIRQKPLTGDLVEFLLNAGSDITIINKKGETVMDLQESKDYFIKNTLESFINDKTKMGSVLISLKKYKNDRLKITEIITKNQHNINEYCGNTCDYIDQGETLLTWAVQYNYETIVECLLENKYIDINKPNARGYTALMRAIRCYLSNKSMIYLLIMKSDINYINLNEVNRWTGYTALNCAIEMGKMDICEILLKNGANPVLFLKKSLSAIKNHRHYSQIVELLADYGGRSDGQDIKHPSQLPRNNNLPKMSEGQAPERMLSAPSPYNYISVSPSSNFPMIVSGNDGKLPDRLIVAKEPLKKYNDKPNEFLMYSGGGSNGKTMMIKIEKPAPEYNNSNPIHNCTLKDLKQTIQDYNNIINNSEIDYINYSVAKSDIIQDLEKDILKILRFLINVDIDVMTINNNTTALHTAAKLNHVSVIELLLKNYPAMLKKEDKNGETPLMIAIKFNNIEAIKLLS